MVTILKLAGLVFEQLGTLLLEELFWIIVLVLILIYRKNSAIEEKMMGSCYPVYYKIASSVLTGLTGGLLGSLLVVLMSIITKDHTKIGEGSLEEGMVYVLLLAFFLAFINLRYLCFAYAGGIIALFNLLFGFPSVNVPGLMSLIGVLHLIESFLIWLDGYTYSTPLLLKHKDGSIIGGYVMNRIWPVPLMVLALVSGGEAGRVSLGGILYMPLVIPVVLAYGDIAITRTPEGRCRTSAAILAGYGIVLLILSIIASRLRAFAFLAAVFAPVAHEIIVIYGAKKEEEGEPYFANKETGVRVLYVKKGSIGDSMKITPGDTILKINNVILYSEKQLKEFLGSRPAYIWMDVYKPGDKVVTAGHSDYKAGISDLGVLLVPKEDGQHDFPS